MQQRGRSRTRQTGPASTRARGRPTWACTGSSWCRTASRCTAGLASPSTTTCTSISAGWSSTPSSSGRSRIIGNGSPRCSRDARPSRRTKATRTRRQRMPETATDLEPVEDFRLRLRSWLADNMPRARRRGAAPLRPRGQMSEEEELAEVAYHRELQRRLFEGGFAGICFPKEYGGQGLTPEHQKVFNEEIWPYDYPARLQVPPMQPCATIILDFGTEEQKRRHIPAILKGEEIWMQFLSEPTGGSDVAGAQTTAIRDGDERVLNGSKIWTTGAWWSDWALCLARTNWNVPKHRGLTVFMVKIHQPGIEVQRIEMLNGSKEFCQEFLTDVRIPDSDRIGEVDDGWTVGTRWMFYEKSFPISFFTTRPAGSGDPMAQSAVGGSLVRQAAAMGRLGDPVTRELIGEAHALSVVQGEGNRRIGRAIATGKMSDQG